MNDGAKTRTTGGTIGDDPMLIALSSRAAAFDALVAERDPARRNALRERYRFACCWVQELEAQS